MIRSGGLLNCEYTVEDVLRAHKIYGPDIASLKGKTKRSKQRAPKIDQLFWRRIRALQTLCIDLFFVCGLTFLLSVSKPLDLMMVTYLPEGKKMEGI